MLPWPTLVDLACPNFDAHGVVDMSAHATNIRVPGLHRGLSKNVSRVPVGVRAVIDLDS